jgi:hypothetical protein
MRKMISGCMRVGLVAALALTVVFWAVTSKAENAEGTKHFSESLFEATLLVLGDDGSMGAGFLVGCTETRETYLVTARHVLDGIKSDTAAIIFRKRLPNGKFEIFPSRIAIRNGGRPLYRSYPDAAVDLAVIRPKLNPPDSIVRSQLMIFSREDLATEYDFRNMWIHPGDEVFFLGFPLGQTSPDGWFPILRSGYLSSYPITPAMQHPFLYLDGPVFEGNSGGPVYFEATPSLWGGRYLNQTGKILGVISFYKAIEARREMDTDTIPRKHDIQVGGFVNSTFILSLLDSLGCK